MKSAIRLRAIGAAAIQSSASMCGGSDVGGECSISQSRSDYMGIAFNGQNILKCVMFPQLSERGDTLDTKRDKGS